VRACVVGNGQSPKGHGDLIDCHDLVFRVNGWWLTHPPPVAGRKITHWSWNSALYLIGIREPGEKNKLVRVRPPRGKYVICVEACRGHKKHKTNAVLAAAKLGGLPVRQMDKNADSRLSKWLRKLAKNQGRCIPSTGLRAVHRAVLMKPEHLTIIGFDATTPDKPGWNDLGNPWRKTWALHGFVFEKQVLASLVDDKKWLGQKVDFSVDWVGRPDDI
jgi:hypothetical protein